MKRVIFLKLILFLFSFITASFNLLRSQGIQHVNHLFAQQGDQYMLIRVDVKNWDHTWSFDGKPYADASIWLFNKTKRKYKVNKLVVALHCGGKNGDIIVDFTPHLWGPIDDNTFYNDYTKIKYAGFWTKIVTSASPFKGFLVEAINIIAQDITLIDEKNENSKLKNENSRDKRIVENKNTSFNSSNQNIASTGNPNLDKANQELAKANQEKAQAQETLNQTTNAIVSSLILNGNFNNYKKSTNKTFVKFRINGGSANFPYYENNDGQTTTWTDKKNFSSDFIEASILFTIYRNRILYFMIEPSGAVGLNGGGYRSYSYGGMTRLGFGKSVSAFIQGGYYIKYADYNSDKGNYSGGVSGFKSYGTFEHDILRIGGGIKIPINKYSDETDAHVELSYFKENLAPLDWANLTSENIIEPKPKADIYKLSFVYGILFLDGEYSPVYPAGGSALFKISNSNKTTDVYYTIRLGFIFDL